MTIPSARDINPIPENLDGQCAEEHFHGRTVEEAVGLFRDRFEVYADDLVHMGTAAFKYYVAAAIQYANSDAARRNCQVAQVLLGVLAHRWRYDRDQLADVRDVFRAYCLRVLARVGEMDCMTEVDYRLERQFRRFLEELNRD